MRMRMRARWSIIVWLLVCGWLELPAQAQVSVGKQAPPLVLRTVGDARFFTLADHVGAAASLSKKEMVVSFFATWCELWNKELPILQELLDILACKQLDAVLVGTGSGQTEKKLLGFARKKSAEKFVMVPAGGYLSMRFALKPGARAGQVAPIAGLSGAKAVWLPPGRFIMGSPSNEPGRFFWEGPAHQVRLSQGFWLMKTEVTQGQYLTVMGKNPSRFKNCGLNCPVENVSWHDALMFANALSRKERREECFVCSGGTCSVKGKYAGKRYTKCKGWRLPTEAEWEYAARAGTQTALYTGPIAIKGDRNAPALDGIAWYGGNSGVTYEGGYDCSGWNGKQYSASRCGTHPVGQKQANRWGLHDMLGNVWEWVYDGWKREYSSEGVTDPVHHAGAKRVLRGCAWYNDAHLCRAAYRGWDGAGIHGKDIGFRLSRSP